jgi:hypothetical protein
VEERNKIRATEAVKNKTNEKPKEKSQVHGINNPKCSSVIT